MREMSNRTMFYLGSVGYGMAAFVAGALGSWGFALAGAAAWLSCQLASAASPVLYYDTTDRRAMRAAKLAGWASAVIAVLSGVLPLIS